MRIFKKHSCVIYCSRDIDLFSLRQITKGEQRMSIIRKNSVSFKYDDLLVQTKRGKKISTSMHQAAINAYETGMQLMNLQASLIIYTKLKETENSIIISTGENENIKEVYVGPKVGYLYPAHEIAVVLTTIGSEIPSTIQNSSDALLAYYLDIFAVKAIGEFGDYIRSKLDAEAQLKGWGIGPSMQPGSVDGWGVEGQKDLYALGRGDEIGLSINNASILVPGISNSTLIGIGPHYTGKTVAMCHECPRYSRCLWRKENICE